ncbi:hypothetical protein PsYK624_121600 [Phanerochaete sordida]|uniref:Uncharacterized protein n=1 Tax=Phanerochaete sordida TaxID=48140 RepID=A0A9P3LJ85_9APHY|nr:hypothetical protein PsYK624_121600 [Phanerochaete sordida]
MLVPASPELQIRAYSCQRHRTRRTHDARSHRGAPHMRHLASELVSVRPCTPAGLAAYADRCGLDGTAAARVCRATAEYLYGDLRRGHCAAFPDVLDPLTSVGCLCLQILAVSLTWAKTYQHWYGARNLRLPLVLSTSLLRDGTLYFLSVLAISIVQIFVYVKNWENYALLVNVLPPILVSRFLFSLRQLGRRKDTLSYSGPGIAFSLPNYLTTIDVFGNIGESVVVQAEADMDKDGEAHNMVPLGTA